MYPRNAIKQEKDFNALEWIAVMASHVPNKGEQMVRYYGYYSNVSRGKGKKRATDELIPSILESEESPKEYKRNWARLIQKIYEVDPLTCPKCSGKMKVISVIENEEVIKKILKHLGLWKVNPRPPPKASCLRAFTHRQAGPQKTPEYSIDYSVSQLPVSDKWLYVDPVYPEIFPSRFFKKESGSMGFSTQISPIFSPSGVIRPRGTFSTSRPSLN